MLKIREDHLGWAALPSFSREQTPILTTLLTPPESAQLFGE